MMNVLQIIPSRTWGGGERYVYDLSEGLISRGHQVVFIGRKRAVVEPLFAKLGRYYGLSLHSLMDLKSAFSLASIIQREAIDVIHVHIFKDAFLAALAVQFSGCDVRLVMTRHLVKGGKSGVLYRWLYRKLDTLIFVSNLARDEFMSTSPKIDRNRVHVVHNSVNIPEPTAEPMVTLREKYGLSADTLLLGFSGRLAPEKGIDTLLEALALLEKRKVALILAGTGSDPYQTQLSALINQLHLNGKVFCEGFVNDLFPLIRQIDIAVAPSRCRESFGLVLLEYMSQGIPVVTTNNGAQSEIITHMTNGFLIDPDSADQLARAVAMIADNEDLRRSLSQNGITRSRDFNIDNYMDAIERFYN